MLNFLKNIFKKNESSPEHTQSTPAVIEQPELETHDATTTDTIPTKELPTAQETTEHEIINASADTQEALEINAKEVPNTTETMPQEPIVADDIPVTQTEPERLPENHVAIEVQPSNSESSTATTATDDSAETHSSWASPTHSAVKSSLNLHTQTTEESVGQKVSHWTQGMAHAIKDKADELEMRAEIIAEESEEAVKTWAHTAEEWVEGMTHAVQDKVDELELRAEIIATEAAQAFEESIDTIEHAVISDAPPRPELLPENAEHDIQAPPPADASTDIDEENLPHATSHHHEYVSDNITTPVIAAESVTVFAGDEEVAQSWTARLARGLSKSRNQMAKSLAGVFGGGKIDEDLYEELETVLITSDMGIEATEHLMKEVRNRVSLKGLKDGNELRQALKEAIYDLIKPLEQPLDIPNNGQPFVIMMAGINGAGKTTSIGKLAKYFQSQGKTVMLAAGDTFRAAAREQLQEWGERNGVTVISQASGDSAAVCFDAVESAKAKGIDIVLADTAGRLPTQLHLMEEIKKVKRVLQKSMPEAPHEIIVVLDANIGQNAVNQVVAFDDALGVTGLIVTKLDGTAKGGVLAALASSRPIPVRYIGVGESIDDLRPFNARAFVEALFEEQK